MRCRLFQGKICQSEPRVGRVDQEKYTAAVQAAPPEWEAIAVYYANRAASNMFLVGPAI